MIALVAYATKHGSTREVADAIGEWLRERGFGVEVMEAHATPRGQRRMRSRRSTLPACSSSNRWCVRR